MNHMRHHQKPGSLDPQKFIQIKNHEGQSTIEFLLGISFALFFIFLFVKVAFSFTNGYLVHYATYMASRAYLVADNNSTEPESSDQDAYRKATQVFKLYNMSRFLGTQNTQLQAIPPGNHRVPYVGVYYQFKQKFSFSDIMGGKTDINYISESYLGREPTRQTCLKRVCDALKMIGGDCENDATFCDNGC